MRVSFFLSQGGAPSGPQLRAVNAVADAIRAEFPEIKIETFAYEFSQKPPNVTVPRDNVIVKLAPINANVSCNCLSAVAVW